MRRFKYGAYNAAGSIEGGIVEAVSREAAVDLLMQRSLTPYETVEVEARPRWWQLELQPHTPLTRSELAAVMRDWATLLDADLPLTEVLRISAVQGSTRRVRAVNRDILTDLQEGKSLSAACAARGSFPKFIVSLLRAGETSGALPAVTTELAQHLERSDDIRSRFASALIYPLVLLVTGIGAVATVATVLVPALAPMLRDSGKPLPMTIVVIEGMATLLTNHGIVICCGVALSVSVAALIWKRPSVALARDRLVLKLPLIGELVIATELVNFSRTLGLLLTHGVPLMAALTIVRDVASNRIVSALLTEAGEAVREGVQLHVPLRAAGLFPVGAVSMMASGEASGRLPEMLANVTRLIDGRLRRRLDRLLALMTPALTLIVGLGVGFLVLSIMNAVLSLNELALK